MSNNTLSREIVDQLAVETNNTEYPIQAEDQSPINEDSVYRKNASAYIQNYSKSGKKKKKFDFKTQMIFWAAVIIISAAICYFLNSNNIQQKQIGSLIQKLKKDENFQTTTSQNTSISQKDNHSKLNLMRKKELITEISTSKNWQLQQNQLKYQSFNTIQQQTKLKQYRFDYIPQRVWHFSMKNFESSSLWTQKCLQQHQRVASQTNHQFLSINFSNFGRYLPEERQRVVNSQILDLNMRYQKGLQPELIKYYELLIKQMIILEILVENGGVYIDQNILLTQNLSWIEAIHDNLEVNAKLWIKKPELVAFHSVELSSQIKYHQSYPAEVPTDRYIVLYPGISSYFLAVIQNNKFLKEVRDLLYTLLQKPQQGKSIFDSQGIIISQFSKNQRWYSNIFQATCQIVLHRKQRQLETKTQVLQYYQIATINQNFGPNKINTYLTTQPAIKIFNHLSRLTRNELQYQFGKMRYLVKVEPIEALYLTLIQYLQKKMIINGSLIHQSLFSQSNETSFDYVSSQILSSDRWEALPAKLWVYISQEQSNKFFDSMWLENIAAFAKESNFELIILTDDNKDKYISQSVRKQISEGIDSKRIKLKVYRRTRIQLISLAVLYEHGGVWIESGLYLLQTLQWLRKISQEQFIWNRSGKIPKVVIAFQPHYGSPFQWKYSKTGAKDAWHLSYDTSFKAAVPKAQLIKDWMDEIITDLGIPFQDLLAKFYQCKISHHRWIGDWNHEKLPEDCLKCVLGAKKVQLDYSGNSTTPNEFYGLWSINGFAGLLKMREYTNLFTGRSTSNPLLWRYSIEYVQNVIGKVNHFVRLYENTYSEVQNIYHKSIQNPDYEFHNNSLFMRMVAKINGSIIQKDGHLQFKNQLPKSKELQVKKQNDQLLKNIPRIIWVYIGGEIDDKDILSKIVLENIKFYANASKFQVRKFDRNNYEVWLSDKAQQKVKNFIKQLGKKLQSEKSNIKDHFQSLVGQYISLTLLYQLGGISISKRLVLHQNLNWLQNVQGLKFVNRGGKSPAKVFGFFGPGYSSKRKDVSGTEESYVQFPSFENYFYAAGKKTPFLLDLRKQFETVVFENNKCKEKIKNIGYDLGWLHGEDPYYQSLFLASQFVISKKQGQLVSQKSSQSGIDYYGLYMLNSRFFAYRLNDFLNYLQIGQDNLYQYLGRTSLTEVEEHVGPLKYLSIIPKQYQLKNFMEKNKNDQKGNPILETSFIHKYFLMGSQRNGLIKYTVEKSNSSNKQWSSLPQNVWIYSSNGAKEKELTNKLLLLHINKTFSQNGYKVQHINDINLQQFLDKDMIEKIKKVTSQKDSEVYKQSIVRLALLQKHGGVSLPLSTLMIQKPTWIKKIPSFSKGLLFNGLEDNPKVLLLVDELRNPPNKWSYSQGTKVGHTLGWLEDFIATEKDSELIKQWLKLFLEYLTFDSKQQAKTMEQCGLKENRRSKSNQGKLSLDILQCIINNRHSKLSKQTNKKQVCRYYGLWGISDYLGPAKFEDQMNFDIMQNELNPFLWGLNQSETQPFIGKVHFMARLSSKQIDLIGKLIQKQKTKEWGKTGSFLTKTLYDSTKNSLAEKDGKIVVKA